MLPKSVRSVHFIAIGGAGMSALAWVLLRQGYRVSGSDLSMNGQTSRLTEAGARIHKGHAAENLGNADLVVVSTAIPADNPERIAAAERGIPIWRRAQLLGAILEASRSLGVAGAHGKTTTTSLAGYLLKEAGLDPTILAADGGATCAGKSDLVVAEVDESDGSFLCLHPQCVIVTNIEPDHLDYWKTFGALAEGYVQFLRGLRPEAKLILCLDCPNVRQAMQRIGRPAITYGIRSPEAQWQARSIEIGSDRTRFECVRDGRSLGLVEISVPGEHNVANTLAAFAAATEYGVDFDKLRAAAPGFRGAARRWQRIGCEAGVTVIDDYAHHPTEIAATLRAARSVWQKKTGGRVFCVFQPQRYTRTQALGEAFGPALSGADVAVVTDIYSPAGEIPIDGVSSRTIYNSLVRSGGAEAHYISDRREIESFLLERLQPGDLALTMGAGDIYRMGKPLLEALKDRAATAVS